MVNVDEYGQYHSPYDHKTHPTEGGGFYVGDTAWDTYRSLHSLQLLLDPQRQLQMVRNIITGYEQAGWLANSSFIDSAGGHMIGQHTHAIIADTLAKGHRDFDIAKAYEGMRKNIFEGSRIPNRQGARGDLDTFYLAVSESLAATRCWQTFRRGGPRRLAAKPVYTVGNVKRSVAQPALDGA